jgi:hypothetical protein
LNFLEEVIDESLARAAIVIVVVEELALTIVS